MEQALVWKDFLTADLDDPGLVWQSFRAGVDIVPLHGDATQGCSCALLRYQPGAEVPHHVHMGKEFLIILRGSQTDDRGNYSKGSFLINPATSSHGVVSEEGCVVLAIWEKPVRFITESKS